MSLPACSEHPASADSAPPPCEAQPAPPECRPSASKRDRGCNAALDFRELALVLRETPQPLNQSRPFADRLRPNYCDSSHPPERFSTLPQARELLRPFAPPA